MRKIDPDIVITIKEITGLSCQGCGRDIAKEDCYKDSNLPGFWHYKCALEALGKQTGGAT